MKHRCFLKKNLEEATKLKGKEQEILYTFIEVSMNSVKFWKEYRESMDVSTSETIQEKIDWGAIAYSDGAGAVGVLIRTWYLASFRPLSWSAIIGAIGWGAAWGSGSALLYQLM